MSVDDVLERLRLSGIAAAVDAAQHSLAQGLAVSDEAFTPVLLQLSTGLVTQFNSDPQSAGGYAVFEQLRPPLARAMFHMLMQALFPEGEPDLAILKDSAVIVFGGLLSAAGEHDNAVGFLSELAGQRNEPHLRYALGRMQRRAAG